MSFSVLLAEIRLVGEEITVTSACYMVYTWLRSD